MAVCGISGPQSGKAKRVSHVLVRILQNQCLKASFAGT